MGEEIATMTGGEMRSWGAEGSGGAERASFVSLKRTSGLWRWAFLAARFWVAALLMLAIAACASPMRLPPVSSDDTILAKPLGIANARFFPLMQRAEFIAEWELSLQ